MTSTIDQMAVDASARLAMFINRSAGQHLRAMGISKPHNTGCSQGRNCTCVNTACHEPGAQPIDLHPEAGNVWFVGAEPDDDVPPLTPFEQIGLNALIALVCIVSLAILAGACGWVYQTFIGAN